jgi:Flp pilus assembly protein TadB
MNHERVADVGAVSTGALTLAAWLADIEIYLRIGVALVGIVVGVLTGLYYYEAWLQKRRERQS